MNLDTRVRYLGSHRGRLCVAWLCVAATLSGSISSASRAGSATSIRTPPSAAEGATPSRTTVVTVDGRRERLTIDRHGPDDVTFRLAPVEGGGASIRADVEPLGESVRLTVQVEEDRFRMTFHRDPQVRLQQPLLLELNHASVLVDVETLWRIRSGDALSVPWAERRALDGLGEAFGDSVVFAAGLSRLQQALHVARSTESDDTGVAPAGCFAPCWRCGAGLGMGIGTLTITLAGCASAVSGVTLVACLAGIAITNFRFVDAALHCSACDRCLQRRRLGGRHQDPIDRDECDPNDPTGGLCGPPALPGN